MTTTRYAGIPKAAIRAFLNRPRKDWRYMKSLSDAELDRLCDKLPVQPPIWWKLHRHQKVCFLLGAWLKGFAFHLDTGMGKSLLSIALARYFRKLHESYHNLILVPYKINKDEWEEQIQIHSPNTSYCILRGSTEDKWKQLEATNALLIVDTYAGFIRMACTLVESKKKKGRQRLKPSPSRIKKLLAKIDGLYLDEATAVKNRKSLPFRICNRLRKDAGSAFTLTGTPFGRDPTDLWAQLKLADDGYTLGETLTLFRAAFFLAKENYFGGLEYKFDKSKEKLLHDCLAARSIRYEADSADLPELVRIVKKLHLPHDAEAYYQKALDMLKEARGSGLAMQTARKNAFLRMRQISSGWLGFKDDDTGTRAEIEFDENPKLDLLISLIHEIRPDRKIIVFHDFIHSGMMIARALKEEGIQHVHLRDNSRVEPKEKLLQFKKDPKCRVFVLSTAGAYGLNLQVAEYGMFYESPVPVIIRKQMIRRFERQGSLHARVFLYDLVVKDTVDQQILAFHKQGADLFRAIVEGRVPPLSPRAASAKAA